MCFCWQQNVLVCVDKQQFGRREAGAGTEKKHWAGRGGEGGLDKGRREGSCPGLNVAPACNSQNEGGSRMAAVVFSADLTGYTCTSGCGSLYKPPDAYKHEKQE